MAIYPRKDRKSYRVIVQYKGTKREKVVEGSRSDAKAVEAQLALELRTVLGDVRNVPSFVNFSRGPYLSHAKRHLKAGTLRNRMYVLEELNLFFGDMRMNEVTAALVESYQDSRRRYISEGTVNGEVRVLRTILSYARKRSILLPPLDVDNLPERGMRKAIAWSAAEIARLYAAIHEKSPKLLPVIVFLANSGCRKGEAIALMWENVNLERRVVTIWPSREWQPKNNRPREIPVNDVLLAWFNRLPRRGAYVFPCPGRHAPRKGVVLPPRPTAQPYAFWPQHAFDRARKAAGLKGGPHTLRHSYATAFISNGGSFARLSEILGHSSELVTRRYRHLLPGHSDADRERVSFGPEQGPAEFIAGQVWGQK